MVIVFLCETHYTYCDLVSLAEKLKVSVMLLAEILFHFSSCLHKLVSMQSWNGVMWLDVGVTVGRYAGQTGIDCRFLTNNTDNTSRAGRTGPTKNENIEQYQ